MHINGKFLLTRGVALACFTGVVMAVIQFHDHHHTSHVVVVALLVLCAAVLGAALAWLNYLEVTRPLNTLRTWAQQLSEGQLDKVPPPMPTEEMGDLRRALAKLASNLSALRASDAAKLERTMQTTKAAIDSFTHGVVVVSADGVVEMTNQTAETLFKVRPGQNVNEFAQPWLPQVFHQVMSDRKRVVPEGYDNALQVFDHNNEERFFLPHATPIIGNNPKPLGVTVMLVDATGLRQIDEAKSSLISTVSHELKTPLTSIQMSLHLLADGAAGTLTGKQMELLRTASEDADRLHRLIQELLDMARLQSRQNTLNVQPAKPVDLLREAVSARRKDIEAAGLRVSFSCADGLPMVQADVDRLRHVFDNLLVNARTYTPAGGEVLVSAVWDASEPTMVRFQVTDTGVGIPADYVPIVFDRFVRVPGRSQDQHGAGLGLAIAREIVQAHGGGVGVTSVEGKGSTFWFTLPVTSGTS